MPTLLSTRDRVEETALNVGLTSPTLLGAASADVVPFNAGDDGKTFPYTIVHELTSQWEVGYGVYTQATRTLSRLVVLSNSLGTTALVNFAGGLALVFVDAPAAKLVLLDADTNHLTLPAGLTTGGALVVSAGGAAITGNSSVTGSLTATSLVGPLTGNAATATALLTPRTINGVAFDGTANIVVTAAAGTLTGSALNATVLASSLTSVGTLTAGAIGAGFTAIANAALANSSLTVNGVAISLGGSGTVTAAAGTLTGTTLAANIVTSSLTGLGVVTVGTWNASVIATAYTQAQIVTVTGTAARLTIGGTGTAPTFDIAATYVGQSSITTLGTVTTGTWNATAIANAYLASGIDVAKLTVGTTLPSNVVASSLTSFGTITAGAVPASLVTAGTFGAGAYTLPGVAQVNGTYLRLLTATNQFVSYFQSGVNEWTVGARTATTFVWNNGGNLAGTDVMSLTTAGALTLAAAVTATAGTFSSGTDASSTLTIGSGGGVPTAIRTVSVVLTAPDSGTFIGAAYTRYVRGTNGGWYTGVDQSTSGVKSAVGDYFFFNGSAYVAALTQAGQMRTTAGFYTTAGSQFGTIGVTIAPVASSALYVGGSSALTGVAQIGVESDSIFSSSATTSGVAVYAQIRTAAAAFTMSAGYGVNVATPSLGAGSAITAMYGLNINNQGASGITNAYGVYIGAQSGASTTNIGLYNAGTSRFDASIAVSAVVDTSYGILLGGSTLVYTGTTQRGFGSVPTFSSAATVAGMGFYVQVNTAAAAFAMGSLYGILIDDASLGASSAVTNQYGLFVNAQTKGTNRYGIYVSGPTGNSAEAIHAIPGNIGLFITGSSAGSASTKYGINVNATLDATTTVAGYGAYIAPTTAASAFTMTNFYGAYIDAVAKGAGSTITNRYGMYIVSPTDGGTNYALYISGTGATFFGGAVTVTGTLVISADRSRLSTGGAARAGNATLVTGTKTVATTAVTANTIVLLTRKTSGGTIGTSITYTVSAGTSFTIASDNILDTSTFSWELIELA
jgi:hypothetical protein